MQYVGYVYESHTRLIRIDGMPPSKAWTQRSGNPSLDSRKCCLNLGSGGVRRDNRFSPLHLGRIERILGVEAALLADVAQDRRALHELAPPDFQRRHLAVLEPVHQPTLGLRWSGIHNRSCQCSHCNYSVLNTFLGEILQKRAGCQRSTVICTSENS